MAVLGLAVLDRRTAGAQALLDWRCDLLDDLGGEKAASAQQQALMEAASGPGCTSTGSLVNTRAAEADRPEARQAPVALRHGQKRQALM